MSNYVHKDVTAKSKTSLGRLKLAQMAKIFFIVFRLTRIIFTGKTSHLNMVYHSIALSLEPFICRQIRIPEELWPSEILHAN